MQPSIFVPLDVHAVRWLVASASAPTVTVFMYLASCANEYGICYPSQDKIATSCNLARSTVQESITWLIESGAMAIAQESSRDAVGRYRPTTYILSPHMITSRNAAAFEMWQKVAPAMTAERSQTIYRMYIQNKNQEQESTRNRQRNSQPSLDWGKSAGDGGSSAARQHPTADVKTFSNSEQSYIAHISQKLGIRQRTVAGYARAYGMAWCLQCFDQARTAAAAGTIKSISGYWIAAVRGELKQSAAQAGD